MLHFHAIQQNPYQSEKPNKILTRVNVFHLVDGN